MNNGITLPLKELKSAVAGLGKVVSKGHALPVLQSVRINQDKAGQVSLQTTDLDSFTTYRLTQSQETKAETIIIPFKELVVVVKGSSGVENIRIEQTSANQGVIHYHVGGTPMQQKIQCHESKEWPSVPQVNEPGIPFPGELRQSLLQAMQCASHDCTRYVIQGAYLDTSDKKFHYVVGTDGRHLFAANSFNLPLKEPVIVPNMKFLNWPGFSDDGDWTLATATTGKEKRVEIQFESTHWTFTTRAVEGTYPNWKQVLPPAEMPTKIEFGSEAMQLIKQVAPRLPGANLVTQPVGLAIGDSTLSLKAREGEKDGWTIVPVSGVKTLGKPVTIHLNRDFLLKAMEFGLTELEVEDAQSAMRFRNGGRQMIVMPVNVENTPPTTPAKAQVKPVEPSASTTPASETKPPVVQPSTPTPTERKTTMPKEPQSSTNGTALNKAIQQVEVTKDALKEVVHGLNDVLDTLKLAQKEQKNVDREMESVRSTIKSLQKVQI